MLRAKGILVIGNSSTTFATRHIAWATGFQGRLNPLVAAPAAVSYGV